MKVVRQLNLEKKEKNGDREVTLTNSQETIKKLPKTSIPPPTEVLCLPLIKRFSKDIFFVEGLYTKTTSAIIRPINIFDDSDLY